MPEPTTATDLPDKLMCIVMVRVDYNWSLGRQRIGFTERRVGSRGSNLQDLGE